MKINKIFGEGPGRFLMKRFAQLQTNERTNKLISPMKLEEK